MTDALPWLPWLVVALAGYLLGSIPSGLWIGKLFFGIDVREYGSHRTGATNVLRTMGKGAAAGATAMDVLKAVLSVALARWLLPTEPWAHVLAAVAVAVGHNWPVFVGFRGGRGVLVSWTATGVLYWPVLVILLVFGVALIWWTRYVSLASVLGAALAPFLFLGFHFLTPGEVPWPYVIYAFVGATLIVAAHKDNIERLRHGTESKFGQRVQPAA
jgi:glycerol-3-phosphate acyltransferase PlsY